MRMSAPSALTAITAITTAAAAAGPFRLRPGFVHIDGTSAELGSVQRSDSFVTLFGVAHFHETKSTRTSGLAIRKNTYAIHLTEWFEQLAKLIFSRIKTEVPNENVFQDALFSVFANQGEHSSKQKAVLPGSASAP